jgi:hypothetical protein
MHYAKRICTYSEDFFMTAFFSLRARGFLTTILIAGGGVTPADCEVPATAMITIPAEVVDGSVPAVSTASSAGTSSLLHFLSYGNINLTPSVIFLLGFNAIFHFIQFTLKDPYFIEITNIPLVFCTTHIYHSKHTYITLKPGAYISNYLNVTAFPP